MSMCVRAMLVIQFGMHPFFTNGGDVHYNSLHSWCMCHYQVGMMQLSEYNLAKCATIV